MVKCLICGKEFKDNRTLATHSSKTHKIRSDEYYLRYIGTKGKCETCGNDTKFISITEGYRRFCSARCGTLNQEVQEKRKQTSLKKYGTESPTQSDVVKNKFKDTCLENFGTTHPQKSEEIKQKTKETCQERYGTNNVMQDPGIQTRAKKNFKDKYGYDHALQVPELQEKRKSTSIERYGTDNYSKTDECKERIKETNLEKYGETSYLKTEECKERIKETNLERYGVEYYSKTEECKERIKETNLEKYDVEWSFQAEEVKNKIKETNLERYGVEYASQSESFQTKLKNTWSDKTLQKVLSNLKYLKLKLVYKPDIVNIQTLLTLQCTKCGTIFKQTYFNIVQRMSPCYVCNPIPKQSTSSYEKEIFNTIKELHPDLNIVLNDRTIISPKELDIYIPSKQLAIEFDGLYWHSDGCKFNEEKDLKNYHLNKTLECKKNDINLIHIFEDEWVFKKDIVISRLKNILGITEYKIYARKCIIKEIENTIKDNFLEQNHIQGKDISKIRLGAFYNNELVSVMTFSKGNISKGSKSKEGIWELNRFCSKLDYNIIGISSKFLKYFKSNYEWEEIYSYADLRWSNGNLYKQLGFSLNHITKPNYWYIYGSQRIHRFNLRKKPHEPKDIPEWILRMNEGYSRIWDCGSLKFNLTN